MTQKEVLQEMCRVFSLCESVASVALFGSRARGDNKERSDYDVAIYGAVTEEDKNKIFLGLQDIPTLLKIDVVYFNETDDGNFKENIKKEGMIFYDRKTEK